jgi:hypothetical protein
MTGISSK